MATAPAFESLLRQERARIVVAIAVVVAIAWVDLAWMAADMEGDPRAAMPPWTPGYFAAMLFMWAIMMVGMMLPSAAPAILLFAALRRHAGDSSGRAAALFACGYLASWTFFSVLATVAQWALSESALLSASMASRRAEFTAALLVAAGLYQLTALKAACLAKCRSPMDFFVQRRREGFLGAFAMGVDHGFYCIGCCWALMALLFAFGVMNLAWIAALAAFVLVEKLFPAGPRFAVMAGAAMVILGVVVFNT